MTSEQIGQLSGLLVVVSAVPYFWRVWQGKIQPNITSWSLWSMMGLALLLTYWSSGARDNIWPALFGFTNPTLITIMAIRRRGQIARFTRLDMTCLFICLVTFALWMKYKNDPEQVQYALYLAIAADVFAAIPTFHLVWREPQIDRPFPWAMFAVGYGLSVLAVPQFNLANLALPIYMFVGGLSVALPLALYRYKHRLPLSEWV